ncbi:ATP-grasp domain-containing protein [Isosphaeraceae bacterium EP7]
MSLIGMGDRSANRTVLIHEYATGGGLAGVKLPSYWVSEGSTMRRVLAEEFSAAGVDVVMTLDEQLPDEPGAWTVARVGPGQELAELERLSAACDATVLVAPEAGGILLERVRIIERSGKPMMGSNRGAIALAGNKLTMAGYLELRGLPTLPTRLVDLAQGLPADLPFPIVIKPIDGAGAVDTVRIDAYGDPIPLDVIPEGEMVAQPYFPGVLLGAIFLVCNAGRVYPLTVGTQRMAFEGGRFRYEGGTLPDPDEARAKAAAELGQRALEKIPGLRGLIGVDLIAADDGKVVILEVNPRVTTSIVGLWAKLTPGRLARAWLGLLGLTDFDLEDLRRIWDDVRKTPRIDFSAAGHVRVYTSNPRGTA